MASKVEFVKVTQDDDGIRLDKYFHRHFPNLPKSRLYKLIREKNIKVDGKKAEINQRLELGQEIRIPPIEQGTNEPRKLNAKDLKFVRSLVLYQNDDIIVINKPHGLAVQGGSGIDYHLDGLLDGLIFKEGGERPRLVHRLDKDTSGVLVLARKASVASKLGDMFKGREVEKTYISLNYNVPEIKKGKIQAKLTKIGESVRVDEKAGQGALTFYEVIDSLGNSASLLKLYPKTGRTHQLRVHCELLGCPIVGDPKYGIVENKIDGVKDKLHLHALSIKMPLPKGGEVVIKAPLPDYFKESLKLLGLELCD
ncbi:MAG: Ribosomal large subunit pseudouridine synthase C [Alphaproteobacteria bacterium ADurb.Bin438]|nr:MAG: Ribosomal large subunit pseudouridine synthase C [Alphaproteobacteria bacterium ADurb.Bin438]